MGDISCASIHLKSEVHMEKYAVSVAISTMTMSVVLRHSSSSSLLLSFSHTIETD